MRQQQSQSQPPSFPPSSSALPRMPGAHHQPILPKPDMMYSHQSAANRFPNSTPERMQVGLKDIGCYFIPAWQCVF